MEDRIKNLENAYEYERSKNQNLISNRFNDGYCPEPMYCNQPVNQNSFGNYTPIPCMPPTPINYQNIYFTQPPQNNYNQITNMNMNNNPFQNPPLNENNANFMNSSPPRRSSLFDSENQNFGSPSDILRYRSEIKLPEGTYKTPEKDNLIENHQREKKMLRFTDLKKQVEEMREKNRNSNDERNPQNRNKENQNNNEM